MYTGLGPIRALLVHFGHFGVGVEVGPHLVMSYTCGCGVPHGINESSYT